MTKPTAAMKEAMMSAELGDDVFGDDPTVIQLEKMCASMFGKPAGILHTLAHRYTHIHIHIDDHACIFLVSVFLF